MLSLPIFFLEMSKQFVNFKCQISIIDEIQNKEIYVYKRVKLLVLAGSIAAQAMQKARSICSPAFIGHL